MKRQVVAVFVLLFAKIIFVHVSINSIKALKICLLKKNHTYAHPSKKNNGSGTLICRTKKQYQI
jgi:hypothetical protein